MIALTCRSFLCVVSLAIAALSVAASTKPNIIFIISDDHRYDCIGAAGNPNVITPNLDRLAAEGLYFPQATMHTPQCSPGRAQNLTGLPPHVNGWYSNDTQRVDVRKPNGFSKHPTVPGKLRDVGYQTVLVGKWHLAPDPWNCGFSEVRTWLPAGSGPYKDLKMAHGNSRETTTVAGFTQEVFGDDAVKFLQDARAKEKPFFMWLALTAPHAPLKPNPDRINRLYANKTNAQLDPPKFTIGSEQERLTSFTVFGENPGRPRKAGKGNGGETQWRDYYAAITMVDEQVGKIRKTLQEQGLDKNTIIVFLGDNGLMRGSRGWSGKVLPYEESVRVPLIVYAPGVSKTSGATSASASSLDLPPSFLSWAGVQPPRDWPGRDLTPVLQDGHEHGMDYAICEFADNTGPKFGPVAYRLVRTAGSKLIVWQDPAKGMEFFDLRSDPRELQNRIGDANCQPEATRLQKILADWCARTHDTGEVGETVHSRDGE